MRRTLLVILVASMLVLGGCTGDGFSDSDDPLPTDDDRDDGDEDDRDSGDRVDGDGELEIHHINVGQADATLLVEPSGETMLIDSGDWRQDGAEVIAYLESKGIDRIDHLVSTHAHADHIGGHGGVIEHYETEGDGIGAIYDSGVAHTSQTYERYLDAVEKHDVDLFAVQEGDSFAFGNATVDIYNPPIGESGTDLHYNSVALTVTFGDVVYLATGDAEGDAEQRMVNDHGADLKADIYQAGHHGSSTSSTPAFLDATTPEIAVVSSAYDSQYGHPHEETLERFADREIETYWSGVHGDVVLVTDGETIDVDVETNASSDASELLEKKSSELHQSPLIDRLSISVRPTAVPV